MGKKKSGKGKGISVRKYPGEQLTYCSKISSLMALPENQPFTRKMGWFCCPGWQLGGVLDREFRNKSMDIKRETPPWMRREEISLMPFNLILFYELPLQPPLSGGGFQQDCIWLKGFIQGSFPPGNSRPCSPGWVPGSPCFCQIIPGQSCSAITSHNEIVKPQQNQNFALFTAWTFPWNQNKSDTLWVRK